MLGPDACTMKCPQCQAEIQTGIKTKPGLVPIFSGILICFVGYTIVYNITVSKFSSFV